MQIDKLNGKSLALLLIGEDENGEDDILVVAGVAKVINEDLYLDRGEGTKLFPIPKYTVSRIQKVKEEIKEIFFEAELFIPLTVGNLPENANVDEYLHTGLVWPDE